MNDLWKEQFQPWILERGRTYHQMGRVHALTHHGREISARVDGTELYHVSVRFSRGMPEAAACDCPYAAKGALCKHIAAVLFALEELGYAPEDEVHIPTWEDALAELPPQTLRILLRNLAESDPRLQDLLLQLHSYLAEQEQEDSLHS